MIPWKPSITMEEFEKQYCKGSNISRDTYNRDRVTLPCRCDLYNCRGWASLQRWWGGIQDHLILHFPTLDELMEYKPDFRKGFNDYTKRVKEDK